MDNFENLIKVIGKNLYFIKMYKFLVFYVFFGGLGNIWGLFMVKNFYFGFFFGFWEGKEKLWVEFKFE